MAQHPMRSARAKSRQRKKPRVSFGAVEQDTGSELYLGPQAVEAGGRGLTGGRGGWQPRLPALRWRIEIQIAPLHR